MLLKNIVPGGYPFGFCKPRYSSNNSSIIHNIIMENILQIQTIY